MESRYAWRSLVAIGLLLIGAARTAHGDIGCVIPQGSTTCSVEQSSPGVIVTHDRPVLNVKVTNRASYGYFDGRDCAAFTYRLFIGGGLVYEASLLPGQDNFDGPGISTAGDNVGRYPPGTYPYREVFDFRIQPDCPPGLQEYNGSAISGLNTYGAGGFEYHLNVSAIDLLTTGVGSRRYTGTDWDPEGGKIKIFWGRTLIKTFAASASFRGNLPVGFPDNSCEPKLRAKQGMITRTIKASGAQGSEEVAFAEGGVHVRGGRDLRTGDTVCKGEIVKVDADGAFVGRALPGAPYIGLRVVNRQTDIAVPGGIFAPTVVVGLSGGRTATVAGAAFAFKPYDPARSGLNYEQIPPGSVASLDAVGLVRVDGNLTVNGDLAIDNGLFYAHGSLTGLGGAHGVGVLIAARNLRLEGPIRLQSDVEDGIAVVAGRKISLLGGP